MTTCKGLPKEPHVPPLDLTWAEQRKQYGRLTRRLGEDEAKRLTPLCQKCVTRYLRSLKEE